ncbi:MAG TPA: ATP-binding protein [Pseudomonadales bacterium]|nr:ATP-binding protein [Pseudomonadales bacterium]
MGACSGRARAAGPLALLLLLLLLILIAPPVDGAAAATLAAGADDGASPAVDTLPPQLLALLGLLLTALVAAGAVLWRWRGALRRLRADLAASHRERDRIRSRLARTSARLGEKRTEVLRVTAERRAWTRAMRRARADLARQGELLASLGHEIRSPLHSLLGVVGLAERDATPALRTHLGVVEDLARHVLQVADDSLELASLERDASPLAKEILSLETELERALRMIHPPEDGRVHLGIDFEPGMPLSWHGDGHRLRQIIVNLLHNAFDHTDYGDVTLSFATSHAAGGEVAGLRIVIRDSGTGIAPEERTRIFMPFVQGSASTGRAGLGLAVVARLVRLMEGRIRIDSEVGVGTRFELDLPLAVIAEDFPAAPLAGRVVGVCSEHLVERHAIAGCLMHWQADVEEFSTFEELTLFLETAGCLDALVIAVPPHAVEAPDPDVLARSHPGLCIVASRGEHGAQSLWPTALARALARGSRGASPPPLTAPSGQGAGAFVDAAANVQRVLVVDDHPVARQLLSQVLTDLGCSVIAAEDGASALEIAEDPEEAFDWVLLDRQMPGIDGLTTAAALRGRPATRSACLVLLVNEVHERHPEVRLVDRVLVRPEGARALARALQDLLAAPFTTPLTAADGAAARPRSEDTDLSRLRDETLGEDLDGLQRALVEADFEVADAHLHRMRGALRLCPEAHRNATLEDLRKHLDGRDREAALATVHRFERLLSGTAA